MNIFEQARALWGTIKMCEMTQEEMAKKLGVSQSYVANKLRLLKFSARMQERITESGIGERQARSLLRLSDERLQEAALPEIVAKKLRVAESEMLVDKLCQSREKKERPGSDIDAGVASCLSLLRLYGAVTEHRVMENEREVILTVHIGK